MKTIILLFMFPLLLWDCTVQETNSDFIPIDDMPFKVDTISVVDPINYDVNYWEVKISSLFEDNVSETFRDTIERGRVVRAFGMKDGIRYQLLEITSLE